MSAAFDADVIIVGQGPTGAGLAAFLGALGVETIALERDKEVRRVPRARMVDGEVMRVFQAFGVADHLEERFRTAPEFKYKAPDDEVLAELNLNSGPQLNGWQNAYMIHQPDIDAALMERVAELPAVRVLRGREVEAVEALDPEGAAVTVRDSETGATSRLTARFVVGCEGGRSLVRQAMGAHLDVLGDDIEWLFVDLEMKRDVELVDYNYYILDTARPMAYLRNPRGYRRFYFKLLEGEDPAEMATEETLWRLLSPWLTEEDATIVFSTVFRFHSLLADRWRQGPMLIAGDAAHQMAPTLGQGLCSGMRDAANLSWKLARVLDGSSPDSLLDTYQPERSPHARTLIETSHMLATWWSILDPDAAEERNRMLREQPLPPLELRLGPGLHPEREGGVGTLFPQDVAADGSRLDDAIGLRFAVIDPDGLLGDEGEEAHRIAADLGAAVVDAVGPEARRWLDDNGARSAVVRPDRYVLGVADTAAGLAEVLRRVPVSTAAGVGSPATEFPPADSTTKGD